MTRMQKICPCQSCGKTAMCVSHDKRRFFCNRCLPYFTRKRFYWMEGEEQAEETKETPKQETSSSTKKSTKKKTSSKKSSKKSK